MIDIQAFQSRAQIIDTGLAILTPKQLAERMDISIGALRVSMSQHGIKSPRFLELEKRRTVIRRLAERGTIEEIREYIKLYHGQDITTDATRMAIKRAVGSTLFKKLRRRWANLRHQEQNYARKKELFLAHCLWFMLWRYGLQMWIDFEQGRPACPSRGPLKTAA